MNSSNLVILNSSENYYTLQFKLNSDLVNEMLTNGTPLFGKIIVNLSANQGDGGSCCCRTSIKLVLKHSYCCCFCFTIDCINHTIKVDKFHYVNV